MLLKNCTYLAAALLLVAGCHGPKEQSTAAKERAKIAEADVKFETSEDPPMKAKTHFAAGQLAESQANYPVAIEQYWDALKLQPRYREPLFRLGIVYCHLQHYPDAIVAWKEYLKASDGDATGYSNLGFCYELAGKHAEALAWHRKLFPLCRDMLSVSTNPIPVKTAMHLLGRVSAEMRLPMCEMDESGTAKVRQTLVNYGLLK